MRRLIWVFVVTLFVSPAFADEPTAEMTVPPSMERVDPKAFGATASKVLIALRTTGIGYPTVNLIAAAGPIPGGDSPSHAADEVAATYRSIGLTGVMVTGAQERSHPTLGRTFFLELRYRTDKDGVSAFISLIPRKEGHLVLTFLTREGADDAARALEQQLFESIRVSGMSAAPTEEPLVTQGRYVVPLSMVILAGLVVIALRLRSRFGGSRPSVPDSEPQ